VTLVNNKLARAAGLIDKKAKGAVVPLFPGMGQYKATLQVGDVVAKDVPVVVMDHPTVNLVGKHLKQPIDGIVGFSFFARYRMTIDYQAKEMTFVPTRFQPGDVMSRMVALLAFDKGGAKKVLAPAGQWGFRVDKDQEDAEPGVTVKAVLPGSAADRAGLKAGDRLLTLDGRWTDTVADCYRAAGQVPAGTQARLGIRRGDRELELTVAVQSGL
jgi:S1-C subfamily serine protease